MPVEEDKRGLSGYQVWHPQNKEIVRNTVGLGGSVQWAVLMEFLDRELYDLQKGEGSQPALRPPARPSIHPPERLSALEREWEFQNPQVVMR